MQFGTRCIVGLGVAVRGQSALPRRQRCATSLQMRFHCYMTRSRGC